MEYFHKDKYKPHEDQKLKLPFGCRTHTSSWRCPKLNSLSFPSHVQKNKMQTKIPASHFIINKLPFQQASRLKHLLYSIPFTHIQFFRKKQVELDPFLHLGLLNQFPCLLLLASCSVCIINIQRGGLENWLRRALAALPRDSGLIPASTWWLTTGYNYSS